MEIPKIGPAAGWLKSIGSVEKVAREPNINQVTIGSFTLEAREGNSAPNFAEFPNAPGSYINSVGLANGGIRYLERHLEDMVAAVHAEMKLLRVSIAPIEEGDLTRLTQLFVDTGVDIIEVNLGCPNVWIDGTNKPLISHNISAAERALVEVIGYNTGPRVAVKLSPIESSELLRQMVKLCIRMGVDELVTMNTRPNVESDGLITMPRGGLSGVAIQDEALWQVRAIRKLINEHDASVTLVGVGGINSGQMLARHLRSGADHVQVGSHYFWHDNPSIFGEILADYMELDES